MVAGSAGAVLGDGGEVRLVLDEDGRRQPFLERPDQAAVPGRQTAAVPQLPRDRVDEPRCADPDAVQGRAPRAPGGGRQQRDGLLDGFVPLGLAADRQGRLGECRAQQIGDDDGDAVGAHIQAGQQGAVRDDAVEPGVGPPAVGPGLADDMDQTRVPQPFDEVRDGRPGEPGEGLQLRGRQRAVLLEKPQGEPVVDGPSGAR